MQNISRKYKINVVIAHNNDDREQLLAKLLVSAGFSRIASDARKIVKTKISEVDIDKCFFVAVSNFRFNESHFLSQKIVRMALQGIPIFIACKDIPNAYLPFCDIFEHY